VDQLSSWDWKFGQTPEFTERLALDNKGSTITCTIRHGLITSVEIDPKTESVTGSIGIIQDTILNRRYTDFFLVQPNDPDTLLEDILNKHSP